MIGMTARVELKGLTVLVTGASSGIGAAMAEEFARRGSDLVLVARSFDRLSEIATRLRQGHGVCVDVIRADLTDPADRKALIAACGERRIDVLVNNAGIGLQGGFVDLGPERQVDMVELNCVAVVELTAAFLPGMLQRRSGGVLNVASTAAFLPIPMMATYAASKAFVLSFSQALFHEARREGVHVLALCPGPVATNFTSGFSEQHLANRLFARAPSAESIVGKAVDAFAAGHSTYLPGTTARAGALVSKVLPRRVVAGAVGRFFQ